MAKNFYAIRTLDGEVINKILHTWDECSSLVKGHNAIYKGFNSLPEANDYLGTYIVEEKEADVSNQKDTYIYYVDGSFLNEKDIGWGFVLVKNDKVLAKMCGGISHFAGTTSRNVTGELTASKMAVRHAVSNDITNFYISNDYQGISAYISGGWIPKTDESKAYKDWMVNAINNHNLDIKFLKVKGHTGIKYNEMADRLANLGTTL